MRTNPPCKSWAVALLVLLPLASESDEFTWESVQARIRDEFPEVVHLSTAALHQRLSDPQTPDPVLLDARSPAEYAVSHLAHARQVSHLEAARKHLEALPADTEVVVYCSVGYRSAQLADQLRRAGWQRVVNLEGSLFEWANKGYPLWCGELRTRKAHPYDDHWGQLLKQELWSRRPAPEVPAPR